MPSPRDSVANALNNKGVASLSCLANLKRYRLVGVEARLHEDQIRALSFGGNRRHRRTDTEFSRLVARCRYNAAFP
jgi:hypothetical protein